MPAKSVSVSMDEKDLAKLDSRVGLHFSRSARVTEDLSSYWNLLAYGLESAAKKITKNEAMLLLDVLNGVWVNDLRLWLCGALVHEVYDSMALNRSHEKWKVDKDAMLDKLRGLSELEVLGVLDWAMQTWEHMDPVSETVPLVGRFAGEYVRPH